MLAGCGYVGPVLPPSPEIPAPVTDLRAVQRGGKIIIDFGTPPRTTDNVAIKHFYAVDLRIGPAVTPFDFETWAAGAREYPIEPPIASDPDDPQPIPVSETVSAEDWTGKKVVVAVRTAERKGDHFSSWSNRVVLDVIAALAAPAEVKGESVAEGVALHWDDSGAGRAVPHFAVGTPVDKEPVVVGTADKPNYVDTTAQFDTHYEYRVVAIKGTAESACPNRLVSRPKDIFPPSVPGNITALAGPDTVEVSWRAQP